ELKGGGGRGVRWGVCVVCGLGVVLISYGIIQAQSGSGSALLGFRAPAGTAPAKQSGFPANGVDAAVLPSGRLVTPLGIEVNVGAPKPYGLALAPDANTLASVNCGVGPFSITLIRNIKSGPPQTQLIPVDSTFMGIVFSADGARFYASNGEDGVIWVGDTGSAKIISAVNLNGSAHTLAGPWDVTQP